MPNRPGTTDYWPRITAMVHLELGSPVEFTARYVFVTIAAILIYVSTGNALVPLWCFLYLFANMAYSIALKYARPPISWTAYMGFVLLNCVSSGLYVSLPIYMWTTDETALKIVSAFGLMGLALFNLARHNTRDMLALWDMTLLVASCLYIGFYEAGQVGNVEQKAMLIVGTLTMCIYYIISQLSSLSIHEKLQETRIRSAQSQKMEAIGRLTGGVAHDFNNILTVVKGNLELHAITTDPQEREKIIAEAQNAASRAASVISQLLAFSRQASLHPESVEIETFLKDLHPLIRSVLKENIDFNINCSDDLPPILVDANQLSSAILNLAINARDAMPSGGELRIETHLATSLSEVLGDPLLPRNYVVVEVKDTGTGIPESALGKVSEPFYTTKPVGEGSGLGLSMVRGFTEQSGGGMHIGSKTGVGTVISLYLPAHPEADPAAALAPREE